jgi:hypothetical protein
MIPLYALTPGRGRPVQLLQSRRHSFLGQATPGRPSNGVGLRIFVGVALVAAALGLIADSNRREELVALCHELLDGAGRDPDPVLLTYALPNQAKLAAEVRVIFIL